MMFAMFAINVKCVSCVCSVQCAPMLRTSSFDVFCVDELYPHEKWKYVSSKYTQYETVYSSALELEHISWEKKIV